MKAKSVLETLLFAFVLLLIIAMAMGYKDVVSEGVFLLVQSILALILNNTDKN